jgi:hypothetical protein
MEKGFDVIFFNVTGASFTTGSATAFTMCSTFGGTATIFGTITTAAAAFCCLSITSLAFWHSIWVAALSQVRRLATWAASFFTITLDCVGS